MKAQYGILRFAKYKGPEIGHIEAHDERQKEIYASNPDVDTARSSQNIHLISPTRKYRAEVERQIAAAGCRTRSDSVRMIEALITASPEFFTGRKREEIVEYFRYALEFIKAHQEERTILSAVIHMDEKTPHMHLCFVPLTEDGRLSAKEIIGNKKKLTWWQDEFWKHMVKKYPALERGESASETGRQHIPTRLYKEAVHLNALRDRIMELLQDSNPFTAKTRAEAIEQLLSKYIPGAEKVKTALRKYEKELKAAAQDNSELTEKLQTAENASKEKLANRLKYGAMEQELADLRALVGSIPPEVIKAANERNKNRGKAEILPNERM